MTFLANEGGYVKRNEKWVVRVLAAVKKSSFFVRAPIMPTSPRAYALFGSDSEAEGEDSSTPPAVDTDTHARCKAALGESPTPSEVECYAWLRSLSQPIPQAWELRDQQEANDDAGHMDLALNEQLDDAGFEAEDER